MLTIEIPDNWIPEREYVVGVIFHEYLGIPYRINRCKSDSYVIRFNDWQIVIKDFFWNDIKDCYIRLDYFPKVIFAKNEYSVECDIPVLFGDGNTKILGHKISCNIDIFAGIFFMLTRWEEIANKERDIHDRFSGYNSLAYKFGFLHRPIVNEYIEMLWNMLTRIGYVGKRKIHKFEIVPTHDIDHIQLKYHFLVSIKKGINQILKEHEFKKGVRIIVKSIGYSPMKDLWFLIRCSETHKLQSRFYFMASETSTNYNSKNYLNTKLFKKLVSLLSQNKCVIGFHPSYTTSLSPTHWGDELKRLQQVLKCEITEGRQHVLMWTNPVTMQIWESNGMKIDSTLGYADMPGFRCGTGNSFSLFDVTKRQKLNLHERPLIIMDATLSNYLHLSDSAIIELFRNFFSIGNKYRMPITILVHNTTMASCIDNNWKQIYLDVLNFV